MEPMLLAIAVTGLVGAILAFSIAVLIYAVGPTRTQNRLVALLLFFAAIEVGSSFGVGNLREWDAGTARGLAALNGLAWLVQPWIYLALLGTLASPLSAPLRRPGARRTLVTVGILMVPGWILVGPYVLEGFAGLALGFHAVIMLIGLVIAISAWHRAPAATSDRARAKAFAFAFGARDIGIGLVGTFSAASLLVTGTNRTPAAVFLLVPLSIVILALLMGYGIARVSLFDIDLRIKWTLRRGTLAGVFLGAFFIVSAIAEQYLQQYGLVIGGVAVGLLLFALRPLERAADRLAERAMPNVNETPSYLAFRKMEVYKAALEEVFSDGAESEKDRRVLERLRAQLGLTAGDANAMRQDVTAARGVA